MVRICNENMANAIRIVTVEEGIDPREFAMIAFGGAGATHACEIAEAINMRRVIVPPRPGLFSAFGALAAIVRVDAVRSVYLTDRTTPPASSTRCSASSRRRPRRCRRAGPRAEAAVRRFIAMRYQGQNYEQEVAVPEGRSTTRRSRRSTPSTAASTRASTATGSTASRSSSCGCRWSRWASRPCSRPAERGGRGRGPRRGASLLPRDGLRRHRHRAPDRLAPGETRAGPLIVESMDSTVVVPPGWTPRWPRAASST